VRSSYGKAWGGLGARLAEVAEGGGSLASFRRMAELGPSNPRALSAMLYTMHYLPDCDASALWHEHREWGRRFCDRLRGQIKPHQNDRAPDRRLRVGYVSPDLRADATVPCFIAPAFRHHQREQFDYFCYSDAAAADSVTSGLRAHVERWQETRKHGLPDHR